MIYLITFLDKKVKLAIYAGLNIHGLYCYLNMIESPTTLTTSCQRSHLVGPSSSTKNDTASLQPVFAAICVQQKTIWKFCGKFYTRMIPESSTALTSSHQVFEEIRTNSTTLMLIKQLIHQESGTAKLQNFTSNYGPLLPKPVLWFRLSWVELFIISLIMVMFRFCLSSIHLNLPVNLFQIFTPL